MELSSIQVAWKIHSQSFLEIDQWMTLNYIYYNYSFNSENLKVFFGEDNQKYLHLIQNI